MTAHTCAGVTNHVKPLTDHPRNRLTLPMHTILPRSTAVVESGIFGIVSSFLNSKFRTYPSYMFKGDKPEQHSAELAGRSARSWTVGNAG
jgi:hypothetical protein